MPKVFTSQDIQLLNDRHQREMENFMLQDEQEILQLIHQELDQLIQEPSGLLIDRILNYVKSH
jgi:hypothetical protein